MIAAFPFEFARPWWLLGLLALVPVWWLARTTLAVLPRWRERLSIGLRVATVSLLVFALAGLRWVRPVDELCVVFCLDLSHSVGTAAEDAFRWVRTVSRQAGPRDRTGLVVFGLRSYVERPVGSDPIEGEIHTEMGPDRNFTDLGRAVQMALAQFPAGARKRIVLVSDGNGNHGDVMRQAAVAAHGGVQIFTLPLPRPPSEEAWVEKVNAPGVVEEEEPFAVQAVLRSSRPGPATLHLYRDDRFVGSLPVELSGGVQVIEIPQRVDRAGSYVWRVVLETAADRIADNNTGYALTRVAGTPRFAYVEGIPGQSDALVAALRGMGIPVETVDPAAIPGSLAAFQAYDAWIFSDVPADAMTEAQMRMLQRAVSEGTGFAMAGGEHGFGVGGWLGTPIEEILPVSMDVRNKKRLASLAVVMVLDKSGSMGMEAGPSTTKMDLANEAAIRTVELLAEYDQAGVLVVDTSPKWVPPGLGPLLDPTRLCSNIAAVRAGGGGILCYAGLDAAYEALRGVETMDKHIILFADGSDSEAKEGVDRLVVEGIADGITLSTVSLGEGHDTPWLRRIAEQGEGMAHVARDASELPRIFMKDVLTVSRSAVVEAEFVPDLVRTGSMVEGVDGSRIPPLLGYITTVARPRAEVFMISGLPEEGHEEDPILARWRYGLGKTIAFTSDCKPRWAAHWVDWDGFRTLWAQWVRWIQRDRTVAGMPVHLSVDGREGRIRLDARDGRDGARNLLRLTARVVRPDLTVEEVSLDPQGAGRYGAPFDAVQRGMYQVTVVDEEGRVRYRGGTARSYAAEFRDLLPDMFTLTRVADRTGGTRLPAAFDEAAARAAAVSLFVHDQPPGRRVREIWRWLLWTALGLFVIDVFARRFVMPEAFERARARLARRRATAAAGSPLFAHLKARRDAVHEGLVGGRRDAPPPGDLPEAPVPPRPSAGSSGDPDRPDSPVPAGDASTARPAAGPPPDADDASDPFGRLKKAKKKVFEEE